MKTSFFKSCLIFVSGILFSFILLAVGFAVLLIGLSKSMAGVKDDSWLTLDFPGVISEKPVSKMPSLFSSGPQSIELLSFLQAIDHAASDKKIKGIIINGDMCFYSMSHVSEINHALNKFKESGKKVVAWFSNADNSNYALCLEADEIYMPDTNSGYLTLTGYSQIVPYFKDGMDKLGLEYNVVHIGDYKLSGENYVKSGMSNEFVESSKKILNSLYNQKITNIIAKRDIEVGVLEQLLSSGNSIFMTPGKAREHGLIDGMMSYRELLNYFDVKNKISIFRYASIVRNKNTTDKIAVIYAEGQITNYFSGRGSFSGDMIGAKSIVKDIKKIKDDSDIKAVVLRVNSPGGSALGSELILQALNDLKKVKPVYASFGPVAASGGYYISCNSDKIFSSPSSIIGSIGVVSLLLNHKELNEKLGINFETIKKYEMDDFLNSSRKPTEREIDILRRSMLGIYDEFTDHVVKGRKIDKAVIPDIAQGRVWTGVQGVEKELVDEVKAFQEVFEYAAEENNLTNYSIISFPDAPSIMELLMEETEVKLNINLLKDDNLDKIISLYEFYLENGNRPCTLQPFIDIP